MKEPLQIHEVRDTGERCHAENSWDSHSAITNAFPVHPSCSCIVRLWRGFYSWVTSTHKLPDKHTHFKVHTAPPQGSVYWLDSAKHSGHYVFKPPTLFTDKSPAITVRPCNIPTFVRSPTVTLALIHNLILRNLMQLWHMICVPVFGKYKSLMLTSALLKLFCYLQWTV